MHGLVTSYAFGGGRAIGVEIKNSSGHFRPDEASVEIARRALESLGVEFAK